MNITNRLYTYPVLSNDTNDYNNSHFQVSYSYENIGVLSLKFKFKCILNNEELLNLINDKKARLCLHIECSLTSYRQMFVLNSNGDTEINVEFKKINGKIELLALVVATETLPDYYSKDFNDDYNNRKFFVDKGAILAFDNLGYININKNIQEFKNVESIFSITKLQSEEETPFNVNLDGERIKIGLPQKQFDYYNINCNNVHLQSVFNSLVIFPTLIYVFETLSSSADEYKDKTWYLALEYNFKNIGKNLSSELEKICNDELTSIELAQIIMDYPIRTAFDGLSMLDGGEEIDED